MDGTSEKLRGQTPPVIDIDMFLGSNAADLSWSKSLITEDFVPTFVAIEGASVGGQIRTNRFRVQDAGSSNPRTSVSANHLYGKMEAGIRRLAVSQERTSASIANIEARIESLTTQVGSLVPSMVTTGADVGALSLAELLHRLGQAEQSGDVEEVAELLDMSADLELKADEIESIAQRTISSDNIFARASAARAYAINNPSAAQLCIPALIESEKNETARSILESTLRSMAS